MRLCRNVMCWALLLAPGLAVSATAPAAASTAAPAATQPAAAAAPASKFDAAAMIVGETHEKLTP